MISLIVLFIQDKILKGRIRLILSNTVYLFILFTIMIFGTIGNYWNDKQYMIDVEVQQCYIQETWVNVKEYQPIHEQYECRYEITQRLETTTGIKSLLK